MLISQRDRLVLDSVGEFRQLTKRHLLELQVDGMVSLNSVQRSIDRLGRLGYLRAIVMPGGNRKVYTLSTAGRRLLRLDGEAKGGISLHSLAVADVYLVFLKQARDGHYGLTDYAVEPRPQGFDADLRPDLFVSLIDQRGNPYAIWLEVDMYSVGYRSESLTQVAGKLELYRQAFTLYDPAEHGYEPFPAVLWVVADDDRSVGIRRLIERLPDGERELFGVTTFEKLPERYA